jgi:competence ComEA-like helix-hairpin-helix protein
MGIIVLGGILLVLLGIRAGMHYFIKPEPANNEQELHAAWEKFKSEQDQLRKKAAGPVNINTADSASLVSLTGIGPKTAQKILLYRQSKGNITNMKQLNNIHHFSEGVAEQLKAEIVFSDTTIVDK